LQCANARAYGARCVSAYTDRARAAENGDGKITAIGAGV